MDGWMEEAMASPLPLPFAFGVTNRTLNCVLLAYIELATGSWELGTGHLGSGYTRTESLTSATTCLSVLQKACLI